MSCRENPYPIASAKEKADALAYLTLEQKILLGVGPQVGDLVSVTEWGDGWFLQLIGKLTELTPQHLKVGYGLTIDVTDSVNIEPYQASQTVTLVERLRVAEGAADRLRSALRAAGVLPGIIELIEKG